METIHFLPSSWKTSSPNYENSSPQSTWGRTVFDRQGIPAQIEKLAIESQKEGFWNDQKSANALFAKLSALRKQWEPLEEFSKDIEDAIELLSAASKGDRAEMEQEVQLLIERWGDIEQVLLFSGTHDSANTYLTVSGGAGGTEAQDWAEMLLRMYLRYCEQKGWKADILEKTHGQEAGIKSATVHISGAMAYGYLKAERGTHRLVRLSPFNAKNLRQTSFALVEVLPEIEGTVEIDIDPRDLKIDTFRSSGAGGQHVNTTDSAVRITHQPTGMTVSCQNERSQGQNKQQAMKMLTAKLLQKKQEEEQAKLKGMKGATRSADFGSQIRSYVLHPYKMVKDLRTGFESSDPEAVLDGGIEEFVVAELRRSRGNAF